MTANVYGCVSGGGLCEQLDASPFSVPTLTSQAWEWPATVPSPNFGYVQVQVTDQAGNQASTTASTPNFTQFTGTLPQLTCDPNGTATYDYACFSVTDTTAGDIPGDPPSQALNNQTFSGYADPSMRADPLVGPGTNGPANLYGTNLWMLYSWPKINVPDPTLAGVYSAAVETHLAYSPTTSGQGGLNWTAWCTPFSSCDPGTTTVTPIWPSKLVGNGSSQPYQYSSHEVPNFWPYVDPNMGIESWYGVHLMYFVQPPSSIPQSIGAGCLVISVAQNTPGNLAWAGSTQPYNCGDVSHFPTGSYPLGFPMLTSIAGLPINFCSSWGEPAIMVSAVPTGIAAAYLAASCFDGNFKSQGYYIFTSGTLPPTTWSPFAGPFGLYSLPQNSFPTSGQCSTGAQSVPNELTEFDWARRADGTLVAVVSAACVAPGLSTATQFGCAVVNFNLQQGTGNPFPADGLIATLTDNVAASGNAPSESLGPNACTYDPNSNTGVLIVRRLVNAPGQASSTTYSLIESGILP